MFLLCNGEFRQIGIIIAKGAASRMRFIAKKRVDSESISTLDRRLKWHCNNGPTEINVKSRELRGEKTCIPFSWVMEMGAPNDLNVYMPFSGYTWEEILKSFDGPE